MEKKKIFFQAIVLALTLTYKRFVATTLLSYFFSLRTVAYPSMKLTFRVLLSISPLFWGFNEVIWEKNCAQCDVLSERAGLNGWISGNDSSITIQYGNPYLQVIKDSVSYDLQSLIGEVGGTLGLLLGLSFLSIFDLLEHLLNVCFDWSNLRGVINLISDFPKVPPQPQLISILDPISDMY